MSKLTAAVRPSSSCNQSDQPSNDQSNRQPASSDFNQPFDSSIDQTNNQPNNQTINYRSKEALATLLAFQAQPLVVYKKSRATEQINDLRARIGGFNDSTQSNRSQHTKSCVGRQHNDRNGLSDSRQSMEIVSDHKPSDTQPDTDSIQSGESISQFPPHVLPNVVGPGLK